MSQERQPPPPARVITGRLVRLGHAERDFEIAFWRSVPPEQRVEALWGMVLDMLAIKGIHGEPRLQRSVGVLRRP